MGEMIWNLFNSIKNLEEDNMRNTSLICNTDAI